MITKQITFDLNGHTLKVTNDGGHGLEVGSGGVVNLDTSRGSFNVTASGSGRYAVFAHDGGRTTVTSATLTSGDMNSSAMARSGTEGFIKVTGDVTATGSGIGTYAEIAEELKWEAM